MPSIWSSLLVFVLVLGAIPLTAWLMRRGQSIGARTGGPIGVVSAVAVGTRERIALVRADRKWLVVGITTQAITLLTELDEAPALDTATPLAGAARFSDLLRNLGRHDANGR
ncbi:MAG: flagellar biosynthetic protein FliO [Burkholderiaceae bacterium]|nr:flagellar biosynthetic protein FliO [Burkholderiaceae bacterium]